MQVDTKQVQQVKTLIRYTEAVSAATSCGVPESHCHFLNMPFYETGGRGQRTPAVWELTKAIRWTVSLDVCMNFCMGSLRSPRRWSA